jgi:hypothetical protein
METFDDTNDTQFVRDAVDIYVNSLTPKLNEILKMKYNYNVVELDEDGIYHLIQKKNTIEQREFALVDPSIVSFVTGVGVSKSSKTKKNKSKSNTKTKKTKPRFEIVSEEDEEPQDQEQQEQLQEQEPQELEEVPPVNVNVNSINLSKESGVPIYNDDGTVTWNAPIYQSVWDSLSAKYKNALLQDHEWLEETVIQYVKDKQQGKRRTFLNPTNLIIPPQILEDGKYDFGNVVYNDIINNQISKIQRDVLISMSNKISSNTTMFMDTLGQIVGKYLGFSNY